MPYDCEQHRLCVNFTTLNRPLHGCLLAPSLPPPRLHGRSISHPHAQYAGHRKTPRRGCPASSSSPASPEAVEGYPPSPAAHAEKCLAPPDRRESPCDPGLASAASASMRRGSPGRLRGSGRRAGGKKLSSTCGVKPASCHEHLDDGAATRPVVTITDVSGSSSGKSPWMSALPRLCFPLMVAPRPSSKATARNSLALALESSTTTITPLSSPTTFARASSASAHSLGRRAGSSASAPSLLPFDDTCTRTPSSPRNAPATR